MNEPEDAEKGEPREVVPPSLLAVVLTPGVRSSKDGRIEKEYCMPARATGQEKKVPSRATTWELSSRPRVFFTHHHTQSQVEAGAPGTTVTWPGSSPREYQKP